MQENKVCPSNHVWIHSATCYPMRPQDLDTLDVVCSECLPIYLDRPIPSNTRPLSKPFKNMPAYTHEMIDRLYKNATAGMVYQK